MRTVFTSDDDPGGADFDCGDAHQQLLQDHTAKLEGVAVRNCSGSWKPCCIPDHQTRQ